MPAICSALLCAIMGLASGCESPHRTQALARETIESISSRILSGFDDLTDYPHPLAGSEALYQVDILRHERPETSYLHIRLVVPSMEGVNLVRVNPPNDAKPATGEYIIRDTDSASYEFGRYVWSCESECEVTILGVESPIKKTYEASSESSLMWVALYDADGQLLRSSYLVVPEVSLTSGLYKHPSSGWDVGGHELPTEAQIDQFNRVELIWHFGLRTISNIVLTTPLLKPIVNEFIPLSVKLAAIFGRLNRGIVMNETIVTSDAIEGIPAAYTNGACRMTFTLTADGRPFVRTKLIAMKPRSPMHAAAGILEMEGESLSDKSRRFRIRLIAARRGATQPTQP